MAEVLDHGAGGGGTHPLLDCVRTMTEALDKVADVEPVFLSTEQKATVLEGLAAIAEREQGLVLRVLAVADDLAVEAGARSAADWLGQRTRADSAVSAGRRRLADALEQRYRLTQRGVLEGAVTIEQARVVVRALDDLPGAVDSEVLQRAEQHLVEQCAHFTPRELRVLGRRVLEVVAPEAAEDHERRLLEAEERRASECTRLSMRARGDGTTDVHIRLADSVAARLRTCLEAYASPRRAHLRDHQDETDPATGERIPYAALMGRAFCSLLETVPMDRLPRHGGRPTAVVVTIDHDRLIDQVGAAGLTTGEGITVAEAMRLACEAGIAPMVFDAGGQPIYVGRLRRLFSEAQQLALEVRDRHCRAEGCDVPAAWCEAHHLVPWAAGGTTDIRNGVLLCSWHHHRAHEPDRRVERLPNGDIRFHRRP